jgi:hypothetical protein
MVYGSELCVENKSKKKKTSYRQSKWTTYDVVQEKSQLERVPNEEIRRIMQAEETVLDRIEARKLRWFRHVMRMPEERWPAIIYSWIPPGRRKRGRPRQSWLKDIMEAMKKRGIREEDFQDWILWRRGLGRQRTTV